MAFTDANFCWSKKAGDDLTFSSLNSSMSSCLDEDLSVVPGRPAEQGQIVEHGLREVTFVPVILEGNFIPAFGEFLPGLVDQERQVGESRRLAQLEGIPEQEVFGRVRHMVLTADHMRNGHIAVVDDVRQDK